MEVWLNLSASMWLTTRRSSSLNTRTKKMMKLLVKAVAIPACILAAGIAVNAAIDTAFAEPETVEYHVKVDDGDTLWSLCGKVASDKDEMSYLVWQTAKENHVVDGYLLQPGQEIVVRPLKV